jgi:hypothetical protein
MVALLSSDADFLNARCSKRIGRFGVFAFFGASLSLLPDVQFAAGG